MNHDVLRVMTYNLLSAEKKRRFPWEDRRDGIVEIFERLAPDVVGTQEANRRQIEDLQDRLPGYGVYGEGNLGPAGARQDDSWYSAIFYRKDRVRRLPGPGDRFWLSPRPEQPASRFALASRPRVAVWSMFEHLQTGRHFLFGTTHLEAFLPGHRREGVRLLQEYIGAKLRELGEDVPVFLTGDFNAAAHTVEIQRLQNPSVLGPGLQDAWRAAGQDESRDAATFRGLDLRDRVGNWLLGHRRIDYVFFRPELEIHSIERVDYAEYLDDQSMQPSDHDPVLAAFKLAS
ncbi:MAG: endonuclease/exonuclease/phosphatase family protein [Candidatus Krumholzibacteriia bacterium]